MATVSILARPTIDDASLEAPKADAPQKTKTNKKKIVEPEEDIGDEEDDDEDDDDDDAGSLVDFIVEDESDNDNKDEEDAESVTSEPPASKEEAIQRDMDGIDQSNIIVGKRRRTQTKFYEEEVFNTAEYRKMLLVDVPPEEMDAVLDSEDENEEEDEGEEEDGSYQGEDESEEEHDSAQEESDDDNESDPPFEGSSGPAKKQKK